MVRRATPPKGLLAQHLALFAPPTPPPPPLLAATLLAETRAELAQLTAAAEHATAACPQSAPLAHALRGAVTRELAALESAQASGTKDGSLPDKVLALRASAAKGLQMLKDALGAEVELQHATQAQLVKPVEVDTSPRSVVPQTSSDHWACLPVDAAPTVSPDEGAAETAKEARVLAATRRPPCSPRGVAFARQPPTPADVSFGVLSVSAIEAVETHVTHCDVARVLTQPAG